jgi:DNA-binding winged helix-turn-helix (wHTH) protein
MKLLALVIRHSGSLVTREEIRAELWPDGTYVDFDQAVNFAVKQVRDALGDSADRPLYLQTVPRRGYRFIAPVETPDQDDDDDDVEQSRQPGTTTIRLQKALWSNIAELKLAQRRQRRMTIVTVVAAVIIVAALVAMLLVLR